MYIMSSLLFILLVTVLFADADRCPSRWVHHNDACFLFLGEVKTTKSAAEAICTGNNAQLASLPTEADERFVAKHFKKHEHSISWWTSAKRWNLCGASNQYNSYNSRNSNSGPRMWTWESTNGLIGFTHKNFGQSDEQQMRSDQSNNNRCLRITQMPSTKLSENFMWLPSNCDSKASVMCMKSACPEEWLSISPSKCIKVIEKFLKYEEQVSDCQDNQGGKLLELNSYPEFRDVSKALRSAYKDSNMTFGIDGGMYLGFKAADFLLPPHSDTNFNCDDVTECKKRIVAFAAWLPGEPKFYILPNGDRNGNNVRVWRPRFSLEQSFNLDWRNQTGETFGLKDNDMKEQSLFVCERSPNSS